MEFFDNFGFFGIFLNFLEFCKTFWNFSESFKIFWNLLGFFKSFGIFIFWSFSDFDIFQNLLEFFKIFRFIFDSSWFFWIPLESFEFIRSCELIWAHASSWDLMRAHARSWELMRAHARSFQLMPAHASSCELMPARASSCQLLRAHASSCELMQAGASSCELMWAQFSYWEYLVFLCSLQDTLGLNGILSLVFKNMVFYSKWCCDQECCSIGTDTASWPFMNKFCHSSNHFFPNEYRILIKDDNTYNKLLFTFNLWGKLGFTRLNMLLLLLSSTKTKQYQC